MIKRQWWLAWVAVLVAGCGGDGGIQSPDFTPVLQSITVSPAPPPSVALGNTQQFQASGRYTTPPGSPTSTVVLPLDEVEWSSSAPAVATIDEAGLATTLSVGTTTITASRDGVSGSTVLTVEAPDLLEVRVSAEPPTTAPLPLGASRNYIARGIYTNSQRDSTGARMPGPIDGTVSWTSSNTGVATISPPTGAMTTATSQSTGNTTITASSPNNAGTPVTGSVALVVTVAQIDSLLRVDPPVASVAVGNSTPFEAIADFSDGSEQALADEQLDWTSSDPLIATIATDGTATGVAAGEATITATLKDGVPSNTTMRSASAELTVTLPGADCSVPLNAASGATVSSQVGMLCVLCDVADAASVIDADPGNFARINVPVGLLMATASLRVDAPQGVAPIAGGEAAGFRLGRPAGTLVPLGEVATAELQSQLTVRTYLGETLTGDGSGPSNPLRLSLLGTAIVDGDPPQAIDQVLVSIPTTTAYDAIELVFSSGVVSAFSETNVFSAACGDLAAPPAP